ncbi:MAG: NADase-type glycan-binding domain-containing protein, partial [Acidimicrobiales bacterium]
RRPEEGAGANRSIAYGEVGAGATTAPADQSTTAVPVAVGVSGSPSGRTEPGVTDLAGDGSGSVRSPVVPSLLTGSPAAAGTGIVAPASGVPASGVPAAVKPAPRRARPGPWTAGPTERGFQPGDLVCGQCGEGNLPNRYFCRRCGASLVEAESYKLSRLDAWRLRRHQSREARHVLLAGERPRARRNLVGGEGGGWFSSGLVKVLAAAVVVLAILSLAGPWAPTIQHHVKSWKTSIVRAVHPTYDPVHPVVATATSSAPGHGPALAIDGLANTYWATASTGDGVGQVLTVAFAQPVSIDRVGFLLGAAGSPQAYLSQPRPQIVHLAFSDGSSKDLTLQDTAKFQAFSVHARKVTEMQMTVSAVYSSSVGTHASLAEIEFFQLK